MSTSSSTICQVIHLLKFEVVTLIKSNRFVCIAYFYVHLNYFAFCNFQDYQKAVDVAEEKVAAANQLFEIVDKYLRKLEQELLKFKMELEADNAGITEVLEKRKSYFFIVFTRTYLLSHLGSLELDNPPTSSSNHIREKRKLGALNPNDQKPNSTPSDKLLHSFAQESNATVNYGSSKNHNNMPQSSTSGTENPFALFSSKFVSDKSTLASKLKVNIPGSSNPIAAAAASQAIAATQNTQIGRRTSSLKASYEAINSGFSNFNFPPIRMDTNEPTVGSFIRQSNDLEQANKKSRLSNKKNRVSHYDLEFEHENEQSSDVGSELWNNNDNEKYCVCNNVSYGEMIYCENYDVRILTVRFSTTSINFTLLQ